MSDHVVARLLREQQEELLRRLQGYTYEGGDPSADDYVERACDAGLRDAVEQDRTVIEQSLQAVEAALDKLAQGTYGLCDRCGEPISEESLRASPTATLCVICAEKKEKRGRRRFLGFMQ